MSDLQPNTTTAAEHGEPVGVKRQRHAGDVDTPFASEAKKTRVIATVDYAIDASKPPEKPKRALSAYNIFVREERQKILAVHHKKVAELAKANEAVGEAGGSEKSDIPRDITFEDMGRMIGKRWKEVKDDPELLAYYKNLANEDIKRYTAEMDTYNEKKKELILSRVAYFKPNESPSPEDTSGRTNETMPSSSYLSTSRAMQRMMDVNEAELNKLRDAQASATLSNLFGATAAFGQGGLNAASLNQTMAQAGLSQGSMFPMSNSNFAAVAALQGLRGYSSQYPEFFSYANAGNEANFFRALQQQQNINALFNDNALMQQAHLQIMANNPTLALQQRIMEQQRRDALFGNQNMNNRPLPGASNIDPALLAAFLRDQGRL